MVNAVAYLQGATAVGLVWFSQEHGSHTTSIYTNVTGVAPGDHGMHIHQYGDLSQGTIYKFLIECVQYICDLKYLI